MILRWVLHVREIAHHSVTRTLEVDSSLTTLGAVTAFKSLFSIAALNSNVFFASRR
jgi:hypothetical protein